MFYLFPIFVLIFAVKYYLVFNEKRKLKEVRSLISKTQKKSVIPNYLKIKANEYTMEDSAFSDIVEDLIHMYNENFEETERIMGKIITKKITALKIYKKNGQKNIAF
jgi:hypothetical protein